jgi:hypothetical protein
VVPGLRLRRGACDWRVRFEVADAVARLRQPTSRGAFELVIAHAFLDLVDIDATLPPLLAALRPGGLAWLTLTFDGATIFEPPVEPALDARIEALYHATMRGAGRDGSRAGRRLIARLRGHGAEVVAAGSSDWVVFAAAANGITAGYPADEAFFLGYIVDTVERALTRRARPGRDGPDLAALAAWAAERRRQIARGELVYIAHHLDVLARAPGGSLRDPAPTPPSL